MKRDKEITENNRDRTIDILRAIGLLMIILAHTSPPGIVQQLRNFDVVLMVLIMGMSYRLSCDAHMVSIKSYYYKRFKRLVFPTWGFLVVFFVVFSLLSLKYNNIQFSIIDYLTSFGLISVDASEFGIGYIWIIRVYFLMAIISPWIYKLRNKLSLRYCFIFLLTLYPVYSFFVKYISNGNSLVFRCIDWFIVYTVGYGFICALGIVIKDLKKSQIYIMTASSSVIFLILMVVNSFSKTQIAKYPPRLYYLSYGLFASLILYLFFASNNKVAKVVKNSKIMLWISENSFWLYLWHIIPIKLLYYNIIELTINNFIVKYCFVFLIAVVLTIIHNKLISIVSRFRTARQKVLHT